MSGLLDATLVALVRRRPLTSLLSKACSQLRVTVFDGAKPSE